MPSTSSVCEAPWCTGEASGMRSRTISFAAAASDARRTVIPFASRAAMVLFTRTSSALMPHRRVSDPSGSTSASLIIPNLLPSSIYLRVQVSYPLVIAYASTFGTGRRCSFRSDPGEGGAGRARVAGLGRTAPGPRHALAPASLRMTELADRALISRSGMTRRVTRLLHEGLVRRAHADADARGVVVQLTNSGLDRLTVAAPVHIRGVSDLFLTKLDDQELAVLETALAKVTLDCTFG